MDPQEQNHIEQLCQGSKESLAFLHRVYRSKVFHFCLHLVRSREVAEEITLDVFFKLWERRAILEKDRSINGLLYKITRDYSISYLRKVARDVTLAKEFVDNYLQSQDHNPVEEQLCMKENLNIADKAIDGLPPGCRRIFQLRYSEDLSVKQIAAEMNISVNTVKKQLRKGMHTVKDYLETNADLVFFLILGNLISS